MTKVDECLQKYGPLLVSMRNPTDQSGMKTSVFAEVREKGPHAGIDIALPNGSDVMAAEIGEVWRTRDASGYGKMIVIKHSEQVFTVYGHLSKVNVRQGDCVMAGDRIGKSGNTGASRGRAGGYHLHFEIIKYPPNTKATINRDDKPKLGISTKEINLREDPTFLFTEEHDRMERVAHGEAFKRNAIPIAVTSLAAGGLAAWAASAFTALAAAIDGVLSLGAAAIAGGAAQLVGKSSMETKASERRSAIRKELGLVVSPKMVAEQLAEAERTGDQSPLQRAKIFGSIRQDVASASGRISTLGTRLSGIERELDQLSSQLDSVEREIASAERSVDAAKLKSASAQREDIEARREKLLKESREIEAEVEQAKGQLGAADTRTAEAERAIDLHESTQARERGAPSDSKRTDTEDSVPSVDVDETNEPARELKIIHLEAGPAQEEPIRLRVKP